MNMEVIMNFIRDYILIIGAVGAAVILILFILNIVALVKIGKMKNSSNVCSKQGTVIATLNFCLMRLRHCWRKNAKFTVRLHR